MLRQPRATVIVCVACAVSVLGHWWIARHSERRPGRLPTSTFEARPIVVNDRSQDDFPPSGGKPPRLLAATYEEETAEADRPVDALPSLQRDQQPPAPVAVKPLTPRQQQDLAAVRAVIEEEMPETSAEERDIWFEELKSLPAEVVRDLLQVRKQLRVLTPDHPLAGPGQLSHGILGPVPAEREIPADPVMQSRPLRTDDWSSSREALEQALAWSMHNVANAATPGYKRWRVVLGDTTSLDDAADDDYESHSPPSIAGRGCRIASLSLDLEQGEIKPTGRELDVAIDGDGFFIVYHEPSRRFYCTRGGAWRFTADRRIACLIDGDDYLLDLDLRIPAEATALRINPEGGIEARLPDQETPQKLGQIQLAKLPSPSRLVSCGNGLLISRLRQEPVQVIPGTNGVGLLRQGSLEQSNVDLEQEQQDRDQWQELLKLLPTPGLPRTARESDRVPH